jgi:hypothetical protein
MPGLTDLRMRTRKISEKPDGVPRIRFRNASQFHIYAAGDGPCASSPTTVDLGQPLPFGPPCRNDGRAWLKLSSNLNLQRSTL